MYCKYCGKEITDDSMFCQHCGSRLDNVAKESILKRNTCNAGNDDMDKTALSTQTIHKSKENSSIIANEIVGNLKMIGIALAILAIYMIGFIAIHQKDITKYDYETHASYFGESCYDPSTITGNWKLHWEEHYYDLLYYELHKQSPIFISEQITPEQFLKCAERLEKEWYVKKESIERLLKEQSYSKGNVSELDLDVFQMEVRNPKVLKKEAKDNAKRDIADWNTTINNYRKSGYRQDLKSTSLYVTLISLLVSLGTRYLLKLTKWVGNSKKSKHI